ncbi:MAG: hypothetical protein K2O00_02185 [Muribaculaceae bacterium]|nr:hypothetical protein [Muribaculaceae bacterium]
MKKTLTKQRDQAFMKVCMQTMIELSTPRYTPSTDVIVSATLRKPAPSYFVDFDTAMTTIRSMLKEKPDHKPRPTLRRQLWLEIMERLRRENGITAAGQIKRQALAIVLYRLKPSSFFLSKSYALRLYYSSPSNQKTLKSCYSQFQQKPF